MYERDHMPKPRAVVYVHIFVIYLHVLDTEYFDFEIDDILYYTVYY